MAGMEAIIGRKRGLEASGCSKAEISNRDTTEIFEKMAAMSDRRFDQSQPKRNSGRTGRRRHTAAEAALVGPQAAYEHRRLYGGQGPTTALPPLPDPPSWFSTELKAIWGATIAAAPPGLLSAIDAPNLVAYCLAIDVHHRLARQAARRVSLSKELERRLRFAAAEVGRASKTLGLVPFDRTRIPIPPPVVEGPPLSVHERFDTILPDGKVVPYAGRKRGATGVPPRR
jgi:hypothetical protein